jgi:nucleoside-diphosphate kinase
MIEKGRYTYTMIKPDAVAVGDLSGIITMIEDAGFRIAALKKIQFTKRFAEEFYIEHKGRPFYPRLTTFMSGGGPVVAMVLEKDNAVKDFRELIGATDPSDALEGTIRNKYGASLSENAIHGSDADDTAERETHLVFSIAEIFW